MGIVVDPAQVHPPRPGRDWIIATIANRQYGIVTRSQLLAAGVGPGAIATRIRRYGLHRLHRGVYVVGHTALVPGAREMAAVLACGPGAVLSHRSAAALWCLVERDPPLLDVTAPRASRARPGLRTHRSRSLAAEDVQTRFGIPITTPSRTLLDLAEVASEPELERALDEALVQRLTDHRSVASVLGRCRGKHGTGRLKALLERDEEPALTRSEAEERFLALVRAAHLPAPEVNVGLHAYTVDFLWRNSRVVVEIDGYRFHSSRAAFERDRLRDARLGAVGFRVTRPTWRQLVEQPHAVVARLAQALQAAPA